MWEEFLNLQEQRLGKEVVDKWLRPLKVIRSDAYHLELEADNPFQVVWFDQHIKPGLKSRLKPKITLTLKGASASKKFKPPPSLVLEIDPLDPLCSFAHFVTTQDNAFPLQFLTDLKSPPTYNPIYIHGPSGAGKTHLLMALAQKYRSQGLHALYVRSETFTEHVVLAMRSSAMQLFRKNYRSVDILLIDDIHILARRTATQEEFFHTFNALHTNGKQIIISSNVPQGHLQEIEPRLVSRFEWGMTFSLCPLGTGDLSCVLERKIELFQLSLGDDVKQWLLNTFAKSCSLTKALEALTLRAHLKKLNSSDLTIPQLESLLGDLIAKEQKTALSFERILAAASAFYGISTHDILGNSHSREHATPRHIAIYLCRQHLAYPFTKLGKLFSRDHSTTMASVKLIEKKIEEKEEGILRALLEIRSQLKI